MGRHCGVCRHPRLAALNKELLAGAPLVPTARKYGIAQASLQRHRNKCLGALPIAAARQVNTISVLQAALPSREEVAGGFASVRRQLDEIVDVARAKGQLSVSVAALDSLRKSWADVARLAGHDRPAGDTNIQLNVNSGPTINIIVDRLLAIVEDLPDVRARMADALLDISAGGTPASSLGAGNGASAEPAVRAHDLTASLDDAVA